MDNFYFFTILTALLSFASRKIAFIFLVIGVFFFLNILPDTGLDYSRYQTTFEGGYTVDSFPFFKTYSTIDAEPLYLWYNSLMSFILNKNFPLFLASNFIVCIGVSGLSYQGIPKKFFYLFWLFLLPVIIPTIFYYSPRSSISFFVIFFAFMKLVHKKYLTAILAILIGISIHSQFILISFLFLVTYFIIKIKCKFNLKEGKRYILIISFTLTVLLIFVNNFSFTLATLLSYLPSADIATAKLHYLEGAREGFRFTSILSIIIYPFLAYKLFIKRHQQEFSIFEDENLDNVFVLMLFAVILYGASINIAYFNNPHLAGRLSRFSDYVGMGLLLPLSLLLVYNKRLLNPLFIFLVLISPIIFNTLYHNVNWGF